jgi:hypothetical protein
MSVSQPDDHQIELERSRTAELARRKLRQTVAERTSSHRQMRKIITWRGTDRIAPSHRKSSEETKAQGHQVGRSPLLNWAK